MKFSSPHLSSVINGDSRKAVDVASSMGKKKIQFEEGPEDDPYDSRMDKTLRFNPDIGALEFPEEGAVIFCENIKKD